MKEFYHFIFNILWRIVYMIFKNNTNLNMVGGVFIALWCLGTMDEKLELI